MRDAIAWSNDLLSAPEQLAFRCLAVFVDGCTLEAAEAVAAPDADTLAIVTSLVDKTLLHQEEGPDGEPRFRMLETIREFGLEQLAASGEESMVRDAHAAYILALARRSAPEWYRAQFADLLARWTLEHANLREALGWLEQTRQFDTALDLAAASLFFWYYHGPISEGRAWLARLLTSGDQRPSASRAKALEWSANLAGKQGDIDRAVDFAAEAVPVARASGDERILAFAL